MFGGRGNQRAGVHFSVGVRGHHLTRSLDIIHSRPWHNLETQGVGIQRVVTLDTFLCIEHMTSTQRNEHVMLFSPLSRKGAAGLDVPLVVFDGGELETLGDLGHGHATLDILLVCKDQ